MNYPPFNLEKALQGEPVAFPLDETIVVKGYLHASLLKEELYIVECDKTIHSWYNSFDVSHWTKSGISRFALGMWVEPVTFEYWYLLPDDTVKIKQHDVDRWSLFNKYGEQFATIVGNSVVRSFFPDCPVGTVIERPRGV